MSQSEDTDCSNRNYSKFLHQEKVSTQLIKEWLRNGLFIHEKMLEKITSGGSND